MNIRRKIPLLMSTISFLSSRISYTICAIKCRYAYIEDYVSRNGMLHSHFEVHSRLYLYGYTFLMK